VDSEHPVILVVEDEPIIRLFECEVAEEAGFLAVGAFNADDALVELEGPLDVQAMLTDVRMPSGSLDGFQLAETVKQRWPHVKVVVTSAHTDCADKARQSDLPFVPKPFTSIQLIDALQV
jgi:two-component system, response regulator PdtaR